MNAAYVQAHNAVNAGAAVVLIANDNQDGYFLLTPDPSASPSSVPVFSVPLSTYNSISMAIQLGAMLALELQTYTLPSGAHVPKPPKYRAGPALVTHVIGTGC